MLDQFALWHGLELPWLGLPLWRRLRLGGRSCCELCFSVESINWDFVEGDCLLHPEKKGAARFGTSLPGVGGSVEVATQGQVETAEGLAACLLGDLEQYLQGCAVREGEWS